MAFCSPPSPLLYDQPLTLALNPLLPPVSPPVPQASLSAPCVPLLCPQGFSSQTPFSRMFSRDGSQHILLSLEGQKHKSTRSDSRKPDVFLLPLRMCRRLSTHPHSVHTHCSSCTQTHTHRGIATHPPSPPSIHPFLHPFISPFICSRVSPSTYLHTYVYRPTNPPTSFPPSCGSICMPLLLSIHVHTLTIHLFTHCFFHLSIICLSNMPFLTIGPPIPRQERTPTGPPADYLNFQIRS